MATTAYRGKLPKPDHSGTWRPYVGRDRNGKSVRFTVGNRRDVSEGVAQRRLDAVRDLFDRQCEALGLSHWHPDVLETARQVAVGQPPTVQYANGDGSPGARILKLVAKTFGMPDLQENYEDKQLARLVFATGASPAAPEHYRQIIAELSEMVRKQVQSAVAEITGRASAQYGPVVTGRVPTNPLDSETRTFHDAIRAYRQHIDRTGDRDNRHELRPHARRRQDRARWLESTHDDLPLCQLDLARIEELVSHWRNRPATRNGSRCSVEHATKMIDQLLAVLRWVDNQPDWKWAMPKGALSIKRKPVTLEQDFIAKRVRRITAQHVYARPVGTDRQAS
jgi:hypothetical protein